MEQSPASAGLRCSGCMLPARTGRNVKAREGDPVPAICSVAPHGLTHTFPFPGDVGLRAQPPHAPLLSFFPASEWPMGRLRALPKQWSRFGRWEPAPNWLLISLGSRWRRLGLAAIGHEPLPTFAGWFQEALPALRCTWEESARAEREEASAPVWAREQEQRELHPNRTMCSYPGTENPRRESRLLSWEYEDCAVRRGDVAGLHSESHWNERPRAQRGTDRGWNSDRRGEGISVDGWSMNGDCEGFWKADNQYMDYRKADSVWKGKSPFTEDRNCGVNEREAVQYRGCNPEVGEEQYRGDRGPEEGREGGRRCREGRGPGEYGEGRRWHKDRGPRDYNGDGRYCGEREGQCRQDRRYGEGGKQYREEGDYQIRRERKKWHREVGGSQEFRERERQYVNIRDLEDHGDFEQHKQLKGRDMDYSVPSGGHGAHLLTSWSSGDSSTNLGSDPYCRQSGIQDVGCNGRGEPEGAEHSRVRAGRPDWSHIWEQETKEENRTGSSLQRNSLYRRTAPSTLRRSEFVQTRKEKQGMQRNAWEVSVRWPWAFLNPACAARGGGWSAEYTMAVQQPPRQQGCRLCLAISLQ